MSEEIDYAERVQRGIALMDEKWPNWAAEIDLEKLDIESGTRCMTAQYSAAHGGDSHWRQGRLKLGLDLAEYTEHGFRVDDDLSHTDYPTVNGLWKAEIERRRAQGQDAPTEPEATS